MKVNLTRTARLRSSESQMSLGNLISKIAIIYTHFQVYKVPKRGVLERWMELPLCLGVHVCVCVSVSVQWRYLMLDCISRANCKEHFSHSHLIGTIGIIRIIINKQDISAIISGNGDYCGVRRGGRGSSKLREYNGKAGGRFKVANGGHLKAMGG